MDHAAPRPGSSTVGFVLALLVLTLATGCVGLPGREHVAGVEAQSLDVAAQAALSDAAEEAWAGRAERAALTEALAGYARLVGSEVDGSRRAALCVRLARGHAFFARAHARDAGERRQHWKSGAAWADRALAESPAVQAAEARGDDLLGVLDELGPAEAEALFWHAINLASWSSATGLATVMSARERFLGCMRRVEELDPEGFLGGVQRFLAVDLAKAPALVGGDMDESRERFEWALEIAPDCFENHVLFAEHWAIPEGDVALAATLLRAVIEGDPAVLPDRVPEQIVEQRRAAALLADLDD